VPLNVPLTVQFSPTLTLAEEICGNAQHATNAATTAVMAKRAGTDIYDS
jgi:hypothetical protein